MHSKGPALFKSTLEVDKKFHTLHIAQFIGEQRKEEVYIGLEDGFILFETLPRSGTRVYFSFKFNLCCFPSLPPLSFVPAETFGTRSHPPGISMLG